MKIHVGMPMRWKLLSVLLLGLLVLSSFGSAAPNQEKEQPLKVLTYNGDRYVVPFGAYVIHENGRTLIYNKQHELIVSVCDDNVQKVYVPTRGEVPITRVYPVPSGAHVYYKRGITKVIYRGDVILTIMEKDTNTNKIRSKSSAFLPDFDGWIEDAQDWHVSEVTWFSAYWDVPTSPSTTSSTIFLFPAIEPSDGSAIIQPVLEWKNRGSPKWTIASWWVMGSDSLYSTPIDVSVGDTIYGVMDWHENLAMWSVETCDVTTNKCTTLYTDIFDQFGNAVFVALEGYDVTSKSDLPGDTYFYHVRAYNSNGEFYPDWKPWVSEEAQQAIGDGLKVEIHYYYGETGIWLLTPN